MGKRILSLIKNTKSYKSVLFLMLLMTSYSTLYSQLNVPVCQDGVVRLASYLTDPAYMGAGNEAPPGHLQKGYWSNTAGLTLSNINDPNAIISGFAPVTGTTYTLTWYHGLGQTYDITVEVTADVSPEYELHNEDGNTEDVLFCSSPNKYEFTVVPSAANPGAPITSVDYMIYHQDGTTYEESPAGFPSHEFNLNPSIGYADLDIFHALVSDGTCLDITTNTIQLAEISSVVVQIQGGKSACDPTIFDGSHVLEVFPYDPNNFDYQWKHNGVDIAGATAATYTLDINPGNGDYTVTVTDKNPPFCGPFTTTPVTVSNVGLPSITIDDNPAGSGLFEICDGTLATNLTTSLGGALPAITVDYDWYQNGNIVTGNLDTYPIDNDPLSAGYNSFGSYQVVLKDANNIECKSTSPPIQVNVIKLDAATVVKANNASPFCISGVPQVTVTITGGAAPYTLTFRDDKGNPAFTRALAINGGTINLPAINIDTQFALESVVEDATGCSWTGNEIVSFQVFTSPADRPVTSASICETSSTTVQMPNSENGIDYRIYRDGVDLGEAAQTGNGGTLTWGPYNTPGTYQVYASTATCPNILMTGSVIIEKDVTLLNINASGAPPYCSDVANPITFNTVTSEDGVDYTLYRNYGMAGEVAIETLTGNAVGSNLSFTPQSAIGTYSVVANRNGLCDKLMTNTYQINAAPNVAGINLASTSNCASVPTTITLSDSETGVTYTLYYDDGTGPVATAYTVNGFTGNPRNIVVNQSLAAGVYTVAATLGTCTNWLAGSITIVAAPNDTPFVTDGYVCNSGSLVLSTFGQNGVTYTLLKGGLADPLYAPITGNGTNTVQFNGLVPGTYTIQADNGTCITNLTDQLIVEPMPVMQTVSIPDDEYCANEPAVAINVDDTEGSVEYELYNLGTAAIEQSITGTGAAISFPAVTAGNYEVRATTNSCSLTLQTGILITEHAVAPANANIPADFCSDDGPQVLVGSPLVVAGSSTGQYSVIGGGGFDPTAVFDPNAGSLAFDPANCAFETPYTIRYRYTDGNGCVVEDVGVTTIHDLTGGALTISSTVPANPCQDDNTDYNLQGLHNLVAVAGTFSSASPGLKNIDAVNGTAQFNPFEAGNGTHVINFDYTDPVTNCTGQASLTINIGTPLNLIGLNTQYCSADNTTYTLDGTPNGGLFKVTDPGSNVIGTGIPDGTSWLNPSNLFTSPSGKGVYTLEYSYTDLNGCINTLTSTFEIVESIDASFSFPGTPEQTVYCENDGSVALSANGALGTATHFYTGKGIAGNTFIPSDPNVNISPTPNTITHTVNNKGCVTTATRDVFVTQVDVAISGLGASYCTNSGKITISASGVDAAAGEATFTATINGNPTPFLTEPGAGDNTAEINPGIGAGVYEVTMEFIKAGDGCEKTVVQNVTVYDEIPVSFWGIADGDKICTSSADITLTGTRPDGGKGNFTLLGGGPGLTDAVADDGLAVLSPAAMPAGNYTVRYNYESTDGCLSSFEVDFEILDAPSTTYSVTGGGAYCIDDPAPQGVAIGLSGSDTGVDYELLLNGSSIGGGVTFTGAGAAFNFAGVQDGEGTYTVVADLGGCTATMSGSVDIEQYELVLQLASKTDVTCDGLDNGTVTLTTTGGSGTYEYSVDGGAWQASPTFVGLTPGAHNFSVRDLSPAACEALNVLSVTILEPMSIVVTDEVAQKINVGCTPCTAGVDCEGSATISISGGTPDYGTYPGVGYDILWSTGGTNLTETLMPVGVHSVTVTDGNGCTQNIGVNINSNPALTLAEDANAALHINNVCNGGATGEFVVTAGGGSGVYEFSLTDPATTAEVWLPGNLAANQYQRIGLAADTYDMWVRDADPKYNRCITRVAASITITEPLALALVEESQVAITCNGATDGSFIVRASNSISGTYEFTTDDPTVVAAPVWNAANDGVDGYEFTLLGAGTYSVWVRDAVNTSCTPANVDVTISDIVPLSYSLVEHTNVSCHLGNNGRLEVIGQGGSGNYVYQWRDKNGVLISSDAFAENLTATDSPYELTLTDLPNNCGPIVQSFIITEPAVLDVNLVSLLDADCAGENTGSIQVDVVGGTPPYNITWSTGATATESISGLSPGNYSINIVDSKGCTYNNAATPYVVGMLTPITLEVPATIIDNTCSGGTTGSIYVKVDGGSGDYNFRLEGAKIVDWSNSVSAAMDDFTFIDLPAGNYDVKVRDANNVNCEFIVGNYTITEPAALSLVTTATSDVTCFGGADGTITVTASGGSGTYQFNVDNGGWNVGDFPALYTAMGLSAGNHTIWVRDSKAIGCVYQLHPVISLSQAGALDVTITSVKHVSCFNAADGEVVLSATGGSGNYDYSKDGGATWDVGPGATFTYSGLSAQAYDFQVRDHDAPACGIDSENLTITQPLDYTTVAVVTDVACTGKTTGQIALTTQYSNGAPGAFTYSIDGGANWQASPITGLAARTYVVDVKDNTTGCIKTNVIAPADATVSEPAAPLSIGVEWITDVTCFDESNGAVDLQGHVSGGTVVPAGDYQFTWYKVGTPDVIVSTGGDNAGGLDEGEYYVIVEDDNGCSLKSSTYTVAQPNDWNVAFTSTNLTKYNGADGSIDVQTHTGGTTPHSIRWYSYDGVAETLLPAYNDSWVVNTFAAGTYRFIITDSQGCIYQSADITLNQPNAFTVTDPNTTKSDISCYGFNDGVINVDIVNGNNDYTIDVVGTLVSGAPDYTKNENFTNNTYVLNGLEAGSYYIALTDNVTNELFTSTVVLTQPVALTITETVTGITCEGKGDGIISVVLAGEVAGSTISWTADNGFAVGPVDATVAANLTQNGLQAGNYTVLVNNNNGCPVVTVSPISIIDPAAWNVTSHVTHVTSFGNNDGVISVDNPPTGNTPPYVIEWADLTAGGTPLPHPWVRNDLVAGDYTYTITDQAGAGTCNYSETITVTQPNQLVINLSGNDATCYGSNDGSVAVDITSGNPVYEITLTGTEYDGSIYGPTVIPNNNSGNYTFSNLKAGTYNVTVNDNAGESVNQVVTISQLAEIAVNLVSSTNVTCYDGSDGAIEVAITGRVIDETTSTINWSRTGWSVSGIVDDGVTDLRSQTGLEEGVYTISVTDGNGCVATPLVVPLTAPAAILAVETVTHVSVNGGTDGRILINNINSDNAVASVVWYKQDAGGTFVATGVTGVDNNTIDAGIYQYIVTDSEGCTYTSPEIPVTEPGALTVSVVSTNINCYGANDGIIQVSITSGTAPYDITLTGTPDDGSVFSSQNSALSNPVFTDLKPGSYDINVTDHAAQTFSQTNIVISEKPETILNTTLTDIQCYGAGNGSITMNLTGYTNGTENWQLIDPNGATVYNGPIAGNNLQPALIEGDYNVIVTNQDGCLLTDTYPISEPAAWYVHHDVTPVTPTGNNNGVINIDVLSGNTPFGGTPDYHITWSDGLQADQRIRTGLTAGTYTYQIEDAAGCTYNSGDIIITEPDALTAVVTASDVDIKCYGDALGRINVTVQSGNEPYSVVLTGNEFDGGVVNDGRTINTNAGSVLYDNLKAGEYQVQITDNVGNVFTESNILINQPNENIITPSVTHLSCHAADKGAGEIALTLNRAALATDNITWSGPNGIIKSGALTGADMNKINVYTGGAYTYLFTDANGCPLSETIPVTEPDPYTITWTESDVTIYGLDDGIIDVHTISGSNGAPYTISWSDDATVTDFLRNDLTAGTYEFTITDGAGCDTTISNIIINQPAPLTVVVSPTDVTCYNGADGMIQIEFTSHNGGYNYQITGNQDDGNAYDSGVIFPASVNSVLNGLRAGTYTIDAYDGIGTHYQESNIRINEPGEVTLSASINDISCYGEEDGSILIGLNGRAPVASDQIVWSGSKGTYLAGDLINNDEINPVKVSEEFYVTVTNDAGCTYTGTYLVNEPDELIISVDKITNVLCNGGNDGAIEVSVSGRTGGGYRYDWYLKDAAGVYQPYAMNGSATLNGLFAGEYQLTVTSLVDNCQVTETDIPVSDGSIITINETHTDVTTCVGDDSGRIAVSLSGGVAPYTVSCSGQADQNSDGNSAVVFENLVAGVYVISVVDARGNGCAAVTKSVTISEPADAFSITNLSHDIDCDPANSTSGVFEFDVTGGVIVGGNYNYQVSLPEASLSYPLTIPAGTSKTESFSNLTAGTYHLTVTDLNSTNPARCAFAYEFTLEHITIDSDPVVNATCRGVNDGEISGITIDGTSGDYTYSWSTTDGGLGLDNGTLNQTGLSNGTYRLTIVDNIRGCTVSKDFTIGVDNSISLTPSIKDVSCNGGNDGAINLIVNGAGANTNYFWTGPGIVTANIQNQSNLSVGNYTVRLTTVIGGQTCQVDSAYTVREPAAITYDARFEYTDCDPYQRTLIVENEQGGSGDYSYLWDGPAFTPAVPADPTNVLITEGGIYTITLRDENQCEVSKTLSVPDEIGINPDINHVSCNGGDNGAIVLNVSGGTGAYTFAWTGPGGYTSTKRNIDKLYAGSYTVVITDMFENDGTGNCFREFTIEIEEPAPIVIDPTVVNTSCFGQSDGQIEIEVSGGLAPYTYSWSPVVGSNSGDAKHQYNLPADTYTLTVRDASAQGGCVATANIDVLEDAEIVLSTNVTETLCDGTGGAIDLTVSGGSGVGFAYDWSSSDGSGLVQGNEDQVNLTGGTYTVVVSDLGDGRSCTASISETLTHPISIINATVSNVSCSGNDDGSIMYEVIGGDGNYVYSWNVIAGDATRIVPGVRNQSGLTEGIYEVTITDGRTDAGGTDCAITHTFNIVADNALNVNVAVFDSKMCFGEPGGRLEASVTGGSGDYKYIWNGVEGTAVHDNLVQGIYGLEVVDNVLGCRLIRNYEVKGPAAPLSIDHIAVTPILCYGEATGAIDVTVSGGTVGAGGYSYTWTGGASVATGSHPTNLMAGTYNLTVTDDNGCVVTSGDIVVTQPASHIKVDNPQITDVSTVGGSDGQILVDVYDGVAPRTVEWFDAANTSIGAVNPIIGLSSGTYRVLATDNNGCTAEYSGIKVVEPGEDLGFEKTVHQISPCNGDNSGEIHITRVFGGFAIDGTHYRIQVTGPGINEDVNDTELRLTGLAPGTYRVIVTDNVPVTYQEDIVISEPAALSLATSKVSDVNCYGASTGEISVTVDGGTPDASGNYLVEIISAEGYFASKTDAKAGVPFSFTNLPAGNYTVLVEDHASDFDTKVPGRGNCHLSDFTLISEPAAVVELTSVSGATEICSGDAYNLAITTSNWNFATQGNLRISVYDDFNTTEYVVDASPYVITVVPASSRTYEITKVADPSNAACLQGVSSGSQVQVTVHELPTANITGPTEVCEDGTVQLNVALTGKQPFSFTWQDVINGTSDTESNIAENTFTFTDAPVANARYIVLSVADDNGCSNSGNGEVDVAINTKPSVTLTGSTDICAGENTTLTIGFGANVSPYTVIYKANGVEGTLVVTPDAAFSYSWNVQPFETTTYEITSVIDAKGCEMDISAPITATVTVNQWPGVLSPIQSNIDDGALCQGLSGIDYSVDPVAYASGYIWSADAGINIISGNGTTDVTVNLANTFTGGYIRVYATNGCGDSPVVERWISAVVRPDDITSAPTGPTDVCELSTGHIYEINPVANATRYEWHLPAGFIAVGDVEGTSIEVYIHPDYPSTVGNIQVTAWNDCGAGAVSPPLEVTVTPLPSAFAGNDEQVCGSTYILQANGLPANQEGTWSIIKGSGQINTIDIHNPNASVTNLSYGVDNENIFVWTVENTLTNCIDSDTVHVYNNYLAVSAITDQRISCDATSVVTGTELPVGTTGLWTFDTGNGVIENATSSTTNVTNLDPDQNILRWTITKNGCSSFANVEVINNQPSPANIITGEYIDVCGVDTTLQAVEPIEGTGIWTLVSGAGVIADADKNKSEITVRDLGQGDNIFNWTVIKDGCTSTDVITVRNNRLRVDAGADRTVCEGNVQLEGSAPPAYVDVHYWQDLDGAADFEDANLYNTEVSNLRPGTNRLVWTLIQNGCISTDTVIIVNNAPTTAEITAGSPPVCAEEAQLFGNAPAIGQGFWSVVNGSGRFDDVNDPNTMVRDLGEGENIFRWTIVHNGCFSYADQIVENLHVFIDAGRDSVICGRTTNLRANIPTQGTGEWSMVAGIGGATFGDINDAHTMVGGLDYGANGFIWKITYEGCETRDTVTITNNSPYPVDAGADQIIAGGTTTLNATPPIVGIGSWSLVAGGGSITESNNPYSKVTDLRRGENVLRWTVDHLGCVDDDEVTITNGETIPADAGLDQTICEAETILEANDPDVGIGEWSVVSGAGKIESINSPETRVYDLDPGRNVFRWTIYYTNSSSSDTVVILNNMVTDANAGPDRHVCQDSHELEANIPAQGTASWSLISGSGSFDDSNDPNTTIRNLAKGDNVLKYEISQLGCTSTDTVRITNNLPTIADAGFDEVVCADSVELRPNTPTFGVGEWRVVEGAAEFKGNWAVKLAPGRNLLAWVITVNGCVSSDTVEIINNQPSVAFAGQNRIICSDSVKLSANIPAYGIGTWELISGRGQIEDVTDPYTMVRNLGNGKNRFRWTINNNGCLSSDDVEISNNYIQSFAGFDQVNCADTALLEANNPFPGTGTWGVIGGSGSANFDDPSNPYTIVRGLDQGENLLTWTISYDGCNSVTTVSITNNNPTPAQAGPNQALCVNNTVLAANTPAIGSGEWTIRNGSGSFNSVIDPSATVTDLAFGDNVFRWTVSNKGCVSIDDVEVSFNRIDASVGPDQEICSDETVLEANNSKPGIGTWTIVGGSSQAAFEDQNNPNTRVYNLAKGVNRLRWTIDYKGCSTYEELDIINNSPDAAYAGNSQEICESFTTLDATAVSIGVGRWEVLTGAGTIANVNDPKSEITGLSQGDNVFRWTVQNGSCSLSDEVRIVNNRPSEPYAGADVELCSPQMTLKANPPTFGTGLWSIESGAGNFDDPTQPDAQVSNLEPGENVLRWTLTQGQCTLSDVITIQNNTPTVANAGPDVEDCKDWSQLDANVPEYGSGSWTVVSGRGDFDDVSEPKTTVRNLGFGENILMWTIQNGSCFTTDQVNVFNKVPDQAEAGADRTICEDYVTLNANNPVDGTGQWSVVSGKGEFENPNQYNTIVRSVGFGTNVYKWTIAYGECTTEDIVNVTSHMADPFAGEDDVTYVPEYALKAANPGDLQGTWSIVAGGGEFDDATFFNTTVRNLPAGKSTFRWTIVTDGCSAYDDVTIDYKEVPEAGFTVSTESGCYPLEIEFTNYSVGGDLFNWEFGDGVTSALRNPTHIYENPGEYTAILTVPGPDGKNDVFSQVITVHDHPIADFNVTPEVVWVPGDVNKFYDLSTDAVSWLWDFGDGTTSEEQNPTYEYQEAGFYSIELTVQNRFGCENSLIKDDIVEAKLSGFITFPNAFKPRPGGSGDLGGIGEQGDAIFKPKYRDVEEYHLQIFNRWGQLIFESHDVNEGWDGTYNDKLAPQAVYVWKVSGRFINGKEFRKAGSVLLVR